MIKPRSISLKIGIGLAGLIVLLLIVNTLLQWDEALTPEAQALLEYAQNKPMPDDKQNAYFAVLGFKAAPGQDPWQSGKTYWDKERQYWSQHRAQDGTSGTPEVDGLPLPALPTCTESSCLASWHSSLQLEEAGKLEALDSRYAEALQRYRALRSYPSLSTPVLTNNPMAIPIALVPAPVRNLWRLSTASHLLAGTATAMQEISADQQYWIQRTQDADTLIHKMLALAYVRQNYQLLAEVAASNPETYRQDQAQWDKLLAPLPASSFDMTHAMQYEYAINMLEINLLKESQGSNASDRVKNFFFLPHSTMNDFVHLAPKWQANDDLRAIQTKQQLEQQAMKQYCQNGYALRNPVGVKLNCMGATSWRAYEIKARKVEATRRLVVQYFTLLQEQVNLQDEQAIQQRLAQFPTELLDPWENQKPARFNAATGELIFDWVEEGNPITISLLINRHKPASR